MGSLYGSRQIGIVMAIGFGAWMLHGTLSGSIDQLRPLLVPDLVQQERERRPQKLGGANLEQHLAEANAFGQAALAHTFWCSHAEPWDEICQIGGATDPESGKVAPGGMTFGVMMDSERITQMSGLYPADGPAPPFSKAETIAPGEPSWEQLPCGGPGYTATYLPATKFFGPALSVTFRVTQDLTLQTFRTTQSAFGQAADAALRACIEFVASTKPLTHELPATAWDVGYQKNDIQVLGLPGASEHLVYDPHTKKVRNWTERTSLTPVWH